MYDMKFLNVYPSYAKKDNINAVFSSVSQFVLCKSKKTWQCWFKVQASEASKIMQTFVCTDC